MNAPLKYRKIVRVLGCTAIVFNPDNGSFLADVPRGVKLMGNLTKNTLLNEFITMVNNYRCVKEVDITYKNLRDLEFYLINPIGKAYPAADVHVYLVVECELELREK
jgi:hypothetical protein